MQVSMKLWVVRENALEIEQMQRKMKDCEQSLALVRQHLSFMSDVEVPLNRIRQCEKQMEEQAGYCMLFCKTLNQIYCLYDKTENELIDYCENVSLKAGRTIYTVNHLNGLYQIFEKVVCMDKRRRLN